MAGRDPRAEDLERMIELENFFGRTTDAQARDQLREVREREQMSLLDRLERATDKCGRPAHDSRDDVGFASIFDSGRP